MNHNEWWQCTKHGAVSLPEDVHSILVVHKDPEVTSILLPGLHWQLCCLLTQAAQEGTDPSLSWGAEDSTNHPESTVGTHGVDSVVFPQNCDQLLYVLFTPVLGPQSPGLPVPPEEK